MQNTAWRKGTEKFLGAYPSEYDPKTIHIQLSAEDDNGNNVLIKKEVSVHEFTEQLVRDERCQVVGTLPFEISEKQQTKQLRRAS